MVGTEWFSWLWSLRNMRTSLLCGKYPRPLTIKYSLPTIDQPDDLIQLMDESLEVMRMEYLKLFTME